MKNLITILMLIITVGLNAQTDTWKFSTDKKLHFIGGVGISYVTADLLGDNDKFTNFDKIALPITASIFAGAIKETIDLYTEKGQPSMHDFGYTVIGGVIGTFAKFGIDKLMDNRRNKRQIKI